MKKLKLLFLTIFSLMVTLGFAQNNPNPAQNQTPKQEKPKGAREGKKEMGDRHYREDKMKSHHKPKKHGKHKHHNHHNHDGPKMKYGEHHDMEKGEKGPKG